MTLIRIALADFVGGGCLVGFLCYLGIHLNGTCRKYVISRAFLGINLYYVPAFGKREGYVCAVCFNAVFGELKLAVVSLFIIKLRRKERTFASAVSSGRVNVYFAAPSFSR